MVRPMADVSVLGSTTALEAFIEYVNSDNPTEQIENDKTDLIPLNVSVETQNGIEKDNKNETKTSRNINLRLRWTILQSDNFSCRKCGRSPAKDQSVILHVDHIIPWSKDGETIIRI